MSERVCHALIDMELARRPVIFLSFTEIPNISRTRTHILVTMKKKDRRVLLVNVSAAGTAVVADVSLNPTLCEIMRVSGKIKPLSRSF